MQSLNFGELFQKGLFKLRICKQSKKYGQSFYLRWWNSNDRFHQNQMMICKVTWWFQIWSLGWWFVHVYMHIFIDIYIYVIYFLLIHMVFSLCLLPIAGHVVWTPTIRVEKFTAGVFNLGWNLWNGNLVTVSREDNFPAFPCGGTCSEILEGIYI